MASIVDSAYRSAIGKKLTVRIGKAVQTGEMVVDDLPDVCSSILAVIDSITTYDQLMEFLDKLSTTWPFFASVLESEKAAERSVQKIEDMFANRPTPGPVQQIGSHTK